MMTPEQLRKYELLFNINSVYGKLGQRKLTAREKIADWIMKPIRKENERKAIEHEKLVKMYRNQIRQERYVRDAVIYERAAYYYQTGLPQSLRWSVPFKPDVFLPVVQDYETGRQGRMM